MRTYFLSAIGLLSLLTLGIMALYAFDKPTGVPPTIPIPTLSAALIMPALPEKVDFAGEPVPLNEVDVQERLDREMLVNVYSYPMTISIIKKTQRWRAPITKILRSQGVPEDFYYLMCAESAVRNATSPAGAQGFWQFMPEAGKQYNLKTNEFLDERNHPIKATYAACNYLKDAYKVLGSWTLAAAAYNMGQGGVSFNQAKQQVRSYYDLYLNPETIRYVYRIVALKIILQDPAKYGFDVKADRMYKALPAKKFVLSDTVEDLAKFAKDNGSNFKALRMLNPWIKSYTVLPIKEDQPLTLLLPSGSAKADTLAAPVID